MDEYPTENLKVTGNLTHIATGIEILEFRPTSSPKFYIVTKEAHFDEMIVGIVKSMEEKQNVESKFSSN